ncbi:MAG: 50S ribosomal protein L11 methyltransferase [Pseudomonadota bacterium]
MLQTQSLTGADWQIGVTVNTSEVADGSPTLTPTLGEYPIYDATLYEVMANDEERNWRFREALERFAKDRVVIDIGTGAELVWAQEAARIGASQVFAIEAMEASAHAASQRLQKMDYADRISLIHAESTNLNLELRADVCVAEIIGSLAGAEGAAAVLSDAKKRLLKPGAIIIPHQCVSYAAAANLADLLQMKTPAFSPMACPYLKQIFDWAGEPFDVRLRVTNPATDGILSESEIVERLDFNGDLLVEQEHRVALRINKAGTINGILTWLALTCLPGQAPLNALLCESNWASIFLPLFDEAVQVDVGDTLYLHVKTALSKDGIHPDYAVQGELKTATGVTHGEHYSPYLGHSLQGNPIHKRLFPSLGW